MYIYAIVIKKKDHKIYSSSAINTPNAKEKLKIYSYHQDEQYVCHNDLSHYDSMSSLTIQYNSYTKQKNRSESQIKSQRD